MDRTCMFDLSALPARRWPNNSSHFLPSISGAGLVRRIHVQSSLSQFRIFPPAPSGSKCVLTMSRT